MQRELKQYGLRVHWINRSQDDDDYEPIDFTIHDKADNVAWVWGSNPWNDVQIECDHPEMCVEWGDDDEQGECKICGAKCDWHWENEVVDEGHNDDGSCYIRTGMVRKIHDWHMPKTIGGIVGEYMTYLQGKW
jgi:hypothetical protein